MKQYGLIGFPLEHSFSPGFFAAKFKAENIDARYDLHPLKRVSDFQTLVQNKSLDGLNVTIPYKEAIIPYLDDLSDEAHKIGAVNTIVFQNDKRIGHNTDAPAFEQVLIEHKALQVDSALVFGSGGASKAITYTLRKLGIAYHLISRSSANGKLSYAQLNSTIGTKSTLWINTTPVGQFPNVEQTLPLPFHAITPNHVCIDLIYNPEETAFLTRARQSGASVINGLSMLHYQAEKAWKLWQA